MDKAWKAPSVQIAKQGAEARDWSWVEASVWTDRMLSALGNGVKGGVWYSVMDKVYAPATLAAAWAKVKANGGAAGVDRQSIERFAAHAEVYLAELSRALRAGDYRPSAIRRVEIPKGDGGMRPLGIPTVKDRIVQTAVKFVLEPILEARFHPASFGFRPGRGAKDALRVVDRLVKSGFCFVVDADLKSYFDTIPHDRLMESLRARVSDGRVLDLVQAWLNQDIVAECGRWTPAGGTPQGAVISPLLANLYSHTRSTNGWPRRAWRWFGTPTTSSCLMQQRGESARSPCVDPGLRERERPDPAPEQNPYRGLPDQGTGLRVPRLPL
jgi:RNA-directed DNA polymerase